MQTKAHTPGETSLPRPRADATDVGQSPRESASRSAARQRNRATQQLLRDWLDDDSGYDEEAWPELKKALEENRSAAAEGSLFRD